MLDQSLLFITPILSNKALKVALKKFVAIFIQNNHSYLSR